MNENLSHPLQTNEKPIEPLKLGVIGGVRARLERLLKKGAIAVGSGVIMGTLAGSAAQNEYREKFNYHPDLAAENDTPPEPAEENSPPPPPEKKEETGGGLLAEMKKKVEEAKKLVAEKAGAAKEEIEKQYKEVAEKYKEALGNVEESYKKLLEMGDDAVYWSAFALAFLSAAILASYLYSLADPKDANITRALKETEKKLNEVIGALKSEKKASAELRKEMTDLKASFDGMKGQIRMED